MARKTNKTSHVLNLITNGNPSASDSPASEGASPDAGLPQEAALEPAVSGISREAAMALGAASEEHAAALRENAAALRENAAALHEVSVGNETDEILPAESKEVQPEEAQPEHEPEENERESALQQNEDPSVPLESAGPALQEEGRRQEQEAIPVPTFTGEKKVIVVDASESDKLSDEIRELLEEHVEREEAERAAGADKAEPEGPEAEPETVLTEEPEPEPSPEPEEAAEPSIQEQESGISPEGETISETVPEEEPEPESSPEPEKVPNPESFREPEKAPESEKAQEPEAAGIPSGPEAEGDEEAEPEPEPKKNYRIVNVMERIMERKNLKADMEKYGVCTCSRCCADVLAFSLTNLPAKYVVVDENPEAPIIGFYENKLKVAILTEFMKACILVKEHPRH